MKLLLSLSGRNIDDLKLQAHRLTTAHAIKHNTTLHNILMVATLDLPGVTLRKDIGHNKITTQVLQQITT